MNSKIYHTLLIVLLLFKLFHSEEYFAKSYWSGEVRTRQSILYGRIEARMKSAGASGVTSTLFTYNVNSSTYNEIDIEIMGKDKNEVQYTTFTPDQKGVNRKQPVNFNPHDGFHIHAIEWTPDYVAWYVDGFEIYRDSAERISSLYLSQAIMLNFWAPGSVDWAGTLDANSLPLYAMYDWIKYYDYTPGVNDNFTLSWKDDFNTFDNNRWLKSTSTFGSNLCDFKPQNVLVKDGYLLLCMTKEGQTASYSGSINDNDIDAPYVTGGWIFPKYMYLDFSEPVDKTSSENMASYIPLGLEAKNAQLDSSLRKVYLDVSNVKENYFYAFGVMGIKDLSPSQNSSKLKMLQLKSTYSLPIKIDIGNFSSSSQTSLLDQKWDYYKEYGTVGGIIKNELNIPTNIQDYKIFQNGLEGITFFKQRIMNGKYRVLLLLWDSENTTPGKRVFDIYSGGYKIVSGLDIVNEVGANNPLIKVIDVVDVKNNLLELYFQPIFGKTILHGIMIEELNTNSIEDDKSINEETKLDVYPNPFNSSTNIKFTLSQNSQVKISLYDLLGRLCKVIDKKEYSVGENNISLDMLNFTSGYYFLTIDSSYMKLTKKILLLK